MDPKEELKYYKKAYLREKEARKEAERILESKAEELYQANTKLLYLNKNLTQNLSERTEEIRAVEEQYRQLVETANDIIFRTNIQGDFTYINPMGVDLSGYESDQLIGQNFTFLVDENFRAEIIQFYNNQVENKLESTYFEYLVSNKKGEEIWLGQNVQLIFENGLPVGFLAVARNITERVKTDNALKESEEKYKMIFDGAFDGVARLDDKGNLVEWNSKMESMLGYNGDELSKMGIQDIIHPDDIEQSKEYLRKLKDEGFYANYTGRVISKSGTVITIEVNSTATFDKGEISGSIDIVRDISERVHLEKEIIRSEEKYRGIIENLNLGLLEVNADNIITKAYPSFCKLTGYEENDLIGKNPDKFLLHPTSVDIMQQENHKRTKGQSSVYEVQIRKKTGEYRWVIISGAPFFSEKGEIMGSIGVHLDISERKKMEIDLKEANRIAKVSSKAKELFLANMSHEIRTPLNAVIGLTNLLKNTALNRLQARYVKNVSNSSKSLLLLVNDILDIAKIESGKLEINETELNLRKTIGTIMSSTSYLAEEKGLSIKLDIDDELDNNYWGDELKICQVLINLVNNAIKFTASGTVTIRIKKGGEAIDGHEIEIGVEDTGKGIAKEALDTIFNDFTQEDNTISKEYGGTGLGLSISKKIVNLLGGELRVDSEIGKGTLFYFNLKMKPVKANQEESEDLRPMIEWGNVKILTVEDNPVNQFVIESTINSWNGFTDIANNGQEAIDMIKAKDYDIILMDMQMPIMDGITTTKVIRQEMKLAIPIIAFTANAMKKEKDRCLAVGMDDYISKPFEEDVLQSKILNLILKGYGKEALILEREETKRKAKEPFFTTKRLQDLSRGNEKFVTRMLEIFSEEGKKQVLQFSNSENPDEISSAAHKIKPSIDYLSNTEMKTIVREIEAKAFIKDKQLLQKFEDALIHLIDLVDQYLEKHSI